MSGPTREQVVEWAREAGAELLFRSEWGNEYDRSNLDVEKLAALAYAAGQAVERDARIAAQTELAAFGWPVLPVVGPNQNPYPEHFAFPAEVTP